MNPIQIHQRNSSRYALIDFYYSFLRVSSDFRAQFMASPNFYMFYSQFWCFLFVSNIQYYTHCTLCIRMFDFNANVLPTINYFVVVFFFFFSSFGPFVCECVYTQNKIEFSVQFHMWFHNDECSYKWHYSVWVFILLSFSLNSIVESLNRRK